ncbi:putative Histidine kinase [Candidatus Terasakiella magnetica]|uniref:histidine kinase n=1 Tax=Candidatus Terasakiella magnetica TaxID=1867952 RepID=A0A1C3RL74_9PROT|nr:ATP-binding protein [Candidatus Terasakiella magnetica]SCA58007.1 putative Histidine kinase [Candidatus Terasakiella magnetica]
MLVRVTTQAQRETISFRIADRVRWLQEIVQSLRTYDVDNDVLKVINMTREQLLENYGRLDQLVQERIEISELKQKRNKKLQNLVRGKSEYDQKKNLQWYNSFNDLIERLLIFETIKDQASFERYRKGLLTSLEEIKVYEGKLTSGKGQANVITDLRNIALGENGLIALQARQTLVLQRVSGILAVNERLSSRFVYSVNDLIRRMREGIEKNSQEFQQLVEVRTTLLTNIVLGAVIVLSLIGGAFIWRILTRLNELKQSMRIHAEGGEAEISIKGHDEISDMADALRYLVDEINHREEEMRISEARFRDVAEATSDWVWETDRELRYSLVSDRFFEITGFSRDDILGVSKPDFGKVTGSDVDDPDKWIHHSNDLKNRRRFRDFIYSIKCPDGVWRQVKLSGKPIFNTEGDFMGYRGTGSDITAETQARSRLMAANEIMPGAFALWDHENRLVLCNRKYYQYYKILNDRIRPGVTFEELVMQMEERHGVRDGHGYADRRRKFREKPSGVFMEALSNGRYLQVSEASTLDGGTVSLVIDITDRIEAETRLEQARLESENANKAKSKFLAAASHDLRQPLHAIGMFLSALEDRRRKVKNENSEGDLRIITNISDSLEALRGLLNALLDISKLDAGVMKAEKGPVMLRPLVERLIKQHTARAQEKGLVLKSFCPDLAVHSDPVLLERILSNLMSNAVRYTQEGGVLLGARRRGQHVLLQVSDTGVGIPEDKQGDIFVEFQQLDNPARDRRRGLGLGLAIVERVMTLLNHSLSVKSVLGKGTTFSVLVPQGELQVIETEDKPVEVALSGGDVPLIVVIDDEPDILEGMQQLITGWKYNVIAAGSTQEALDALDETDEIPNLILADYRLQEELTGADSIRMIHEKLGKEIPAAIITGDTAPDRIQEAKSSGFVLLHKPLRPAKLRQLIRSVQVKTFPGQT